MTINSAIQESQVLYYTIGKLILSEAQKSATFRPQLTGKNRRRKQKKGGVKYRPTSGPQSKQPRASLRNNLKWPNLCMNISPDFYHQAK